MVHNRYMARKMKDALNEIDKEIEDEVNSVLQNTNSSKSGATKWAPITVKRLCVETFSILSSLSLVPTLWYLIYVYWPEEDNI